MNWQPWVIAASGEGRWYFAFVSPALILCNLRHFVKFAQVSEAMHMDRDTAAYIFRYYHHFMTLTEHLASRHLGSTMKLTHGQSDSVAQSKAAQLAKNDARRKLFSDDPEVLRMAADGFDAFQMRVAERIFEMHRQQIFFNHCPKCGKLAKTPKAKQCRFCLNDWHTITI